MAEFEVVSPFKPSGDQPGAIAALVDGVRPGTATRPCRASPGRGKTATIAWMIEQVQRPTLIIEPNKSLAAQLSSELRELFPKNRVEFFVSYYDYYQPEAYLPTTDTYIEKDSSINDEIDRLRHATTSSLLMRRDVIVVASVSCIYGLGSPDEYRDRIAGPARWASSTTSGTSSGGWSTCSTTATTSTWSGGRSGPGATRSRSTRPTRSRRCGSRSSATRSSASCPSTC